MTRESQRERELRKCVNDCARAHAFNLLQSNFISDRDYKVSRYLTLYVYLDVIECYSRKPSSVAATYCHVLSVIKL